MVENYLKYVNIEKDLNVKLKVPIPLFDGWN